MSFLAFVTGQRGAHFHTFTRCKGHMTLQAVEVTCRRLWPVEIDVHLILHRSCHGALIPSEIKDTSVLKSLSGFILS